MRGGGGLRQERAKCLAQNLEFTLARRVVANSAATMKYKQSGYFTHPTPIRFFPGLHHFVRACEHSAPESRTRPIVGWTAKRGAFTLA
jgi:hypothetical protein